MHGVAAAPSSSRRVTPRLLIKIPFCCMGDWRFGQSGPRDVAADFGLGNGTLGKKATWAFRFTLDAKVSHSLTCICSILVLASGEAALLFPPGGFTSFTAHMPLLVLYSIGVH